MPSDAGQRVQPRPHPHGDGRSGRLDRAGLRFWLPSNTLAGFVAATLAVLVITYFSHQAQESRTASARRMSQTLELTSHVESLLSLLKDAETGQRAFLLTGNDEYLAPYEAAVARIP